MCLHLFVRHEGLDENGNVLPDTGLNLPGGGNKNDIKIPIDPAFVDSSSSEEEEVDYNDDQEEVQ